MTTKKNLVEAMSQLNVKDKNSSSSSVKVSKPSKKRNAYREGKKAITCYYDVLVNKQLKQIALDKDMTLQDLLGEAINDLFEKYGKSRIAQ